MREHYPASDRLGKEVKLDGLGLGAVGGAAALALAGVLALAAVVTRAATALALAGILALAGVRVLVVVVYHRGGELPRGRARASKPAR